MRLIGLFAASITALALFAAPALANDWKTIRIGTEAAYAPFNDLDAHDQPIGFDIDIAKALCTRLQATCTFMVQDWDSLVPGLKAGKFDAIVSSMSISAERRRDVTFTSKYYQRPVSFMARKDSRVATWDAAGLKDKVIGVETGTSHARFLQNEVQPGGAQIKLYETQDEANIDLATGRLDAVFADRIVLSGWLGRPDSACCEVKADIDVARYAKYFGQGAGIAVRKTDADLAEKLNKAIADIVADGTYKTINDKYFPFSIY